MSSVRNLKQFVNDRLAAAAEEIFGVFQLTVSELENELKRQRELLDVFQNQPVVLLKHIDVCLKLQVTEQEESPEQECIPGLKREEPKKKKEDEKQDAFVQVKTEAEDQREALPLSTRSSIQQVKSEDDKDNRVKSDQELHALHRPDHQTSSSSESDTDDSEDWGDTSDTHSGWNAEKNLKVHLSGKKDVPEQKLLICPGCGRIFSTRSGLTIHRKTCPYRDEEHFSCFHCDKWFTKIWHLNEHLRTHTGEKPFICSVCGARFSTGGNLKRHVQIHTGEKPHTCLQCGKCFFSTSDLKRHIPKCPFTS